MQIPRVELIEMGPSMNLALRRLRPAGQDMEHEAMARPKTTKKKVRFLLNLLKLGSIVSLWPVEQSDLAKG